MRRLRIFFIRPGDIIALINNTMRVKLEGSPDDAVVVAVGFDIQRNSFGVVVEHASFEEVPDSEEIPKFSSRLEFEKTGSNFCSRDPLREKVPVKFREFF